MNYINKKFKYSVVFHIKPLNNKYHNITTVFTHTKKHCLQVKREFLETYNCIGKVRKIGK